MALWGKWINFDAGIPKVERQDQWGAGVSGRFWLNAIRASY